LCAISDRPHRATRKNKDFALADRIRDRLKANHVVFKDTPLGMRRLKLAKVAERP
jgi:cysteinyl-tRNA synthetase